MSWTVRRELAAGVAAPAHEADRTLFIADLDLGEVAPPAFDRINLITLPCTGGREHQRLNLAGIADEAGCGHSDQPAPRDLGGGPAQA